MLSVVIPSRSDQWLQKTVDDLFLKAEGEIEVIVVYDGRWANPILKDRSNLVQVHHGELFNNYGMRASINLGMDLAQGEYVMKIDEQCAVDQGFDVKLIQNCEADWVVIPRRKRLDAENWKVVEDNRPPIDYMQVDYPYQRPLDKTCGLHGAEWKRLERADILIDDTPTMQGSCYFMRKSYWDKLFPNGLDDKNYGTFTQEAQEISMKVWLSGGSVKVNKLTWYAHWHKGRQGKGYSFNNAQYKRHLAGTERGRLYAIQYWLTTQDFKHNFVWYIDEKFPDSPGWENWKDRITADSAKDFSTTYKPGEYKPSW
jgi:hypothetical protein